MNITNLVVQIKFSELSLDMYRMLQAVEREPSLSVDDGPRQGKDGNAEGEISQRENPHKYLLYKPTLSQLLTYLSSAFKDLPPHSVLMVYVSADAVADTPSTAKTSSAHYHVSPAASYEMGGVRTSFKRDHYLSTALNGLSLNAASTSDSMHRRMPSAHFKDAHWCDP